MKSTLSISSLQDEVVASYSESVLLNLHWPFSYSPNYGVCRLFGFHPTSFIDNERIFACFSHLSSLYNLHHSCNTQYNNSRSIMAATTQASWFATTSQRQVFCCNRQEPLIAHPAVTFGQIMSKIGTFVAKLSNDEDAFLLSKVSKQTR